MSGRKHGQPIPFGLRGDQIVDISMVKHGLACNCICPWCNEKLVAKKGDERIPHFAHISKKVCKNGMETSVALALSKVLRDENCFNLPSVTVSRTSSKRLYGLPNGEVPLVGIETNIELDNGTERQTAAMKLCIEHDDQTHDIYVHIVTTPDMLEPLASFYRSLLIPVLGVFANQMSEDGIVFSTLEKVKNGAFIEWIYAPTLEDLSNNTKSKNHKNTTNSSFCKKSILKQSMFDF